jgi:hypothetical protein
VLRAAAVVRNRRFVEAEMRAENNLGQMLERYGALG